MHTNVSAYKSVCIQMRKLALVHTHTGNLEYGYMKQGHFVMQSIFHTLVLSGCCARLGKGITSLLAQSQFLLAPYK